MSGVEVSRRLRIFLANLAIASGWALKGACKPCAHGLFTTARWLVPEAQRFFVQRLSAPNRSQMSFEWLRSRMQLRILAGLMVVLAFWGALNFADQRKGHTGPRRQVRVSARAVRLSGKQHHYRQQIFANAGLCFRNWFHLGGANCTGSAS